jgi:hypothetical protein
MDSEKENKNHCLDCSGKGKTGKSGRIYRNIRKEIVRLFEKKTIQERIPLTGVYFIFFNFFSLKL